MISTVNYKSVTETLLLTFETKNLLAMIVAGRFFSPPFHFFNILSITEQHSSTEAPITASVKILPLQSTKYEIGYTDVGSNS